jgi:(E)-4-hydroxy-3-methylbut-2-enyl-diphosphate synthase
LPKSPEIKIGNIAIGGDNPVLVQSMTNVPTSNIQASVEQCIRIFDAGGDMVRLTTQGLKEIECLKEIREELNKKGYLKPLVADVHFKPSVAEEAAKIVEKVRINPGNYATLHTGRTEPFTPTEYAKELTTIREFLKPLIEISITKNTVIRIGVNHGSLSERILSRYGDTPEGMAESAMEFLRIFHAAKCQNLVVSMKASNPRIMVYANRLLMKKMQAEDLIFPIHLGVTEAGEGEDGRIKSTIGIASLLQDGIGDTIRVSLTEEPEAEIPVAKKIIEFFASDKRDLPIPGHSHHTWNPFAYEKRVSLPSEKIGGRHVPIVILKISDPRGKEFPLTEAGYTFSSDGTLQTGYGAADYIFLEDENWFSVPGKAIHAICNYPAWKTRHKSLTHHYPMIDLKEYDQVKKEILGLHFLRIKLGDIEFKLLEILDTDFLGCIILELPETDVLNKTRQFFTVLSKRNCRIPVILHKSYNSESFENLVIQASGELGPLFLDGLGDGIWIEENKLEVEPSFLRSLSFGILQASGMRISKTEFISCPGCGRTLFNLQAITQKIREATSHLAGLKIAIMGCVVNGPGEMADADYGYVGAGPGKVNLYRAHELIKQGIPEDNALPELIDLIRADGKWVEKA